MYRQIHGSRNSDPERQTLHALSSLAPTFNESRYPGGTTLKTKGAMVVRGKSEWVLIKLKWFEGGNWKI